MQGSPERIRRSEVSATGAGSVFGRAFPLPAARLAEDSLNEINRRLIGDVNAGGEFFLSSTVLDDRFSLRVAIGNIHTRRAHLDRLWKLLTLKAGETGSAAV